MSIGESHGYPKSTMSAGDMVKELGRIGRFADGLYVGTCANCERSFIGDKRATQCLPCAVKSMESYYAARIEELEKLAQTNADELRSQGWAVAVHNDYWLDGERHTFWLFTHRNGRWVKGEGKTDAEAISKAMKDAAAFGELAEEGGEK